MFDNSIKQDDQKLTCLLHEVVTYLSKERRENCYEIEHWNRNQHVIAFPSHTQSMSAFMPHI
jgi:hypothetical protein